MLNNDMDQSLFAILGMLAAGFALPFVMAWLEGSPGTEQLASQTRYLSTARRWVGRAWARVAGGQAHE